MGWKASAWRAAVVATALAGLVLVPGSSLAQQDQGRGDKGGAQAQKQNENAPAKETKGARRKSKPPAGQQATSKKPSAPQQAAPQRAPQQLPPSAKTRAVPKRQRRATTGATTPSQPAAKARQRRQPTGPTAAPPRAPTAPPTPRAGQPKARRTPRVKPPAGAAPAAPRMPAVVRPQRPSRALQGLPPAVKTPPPGPVSREALTRRIPPASFRGPQAGRKAVTITPQVRQRGVQQLNGWIKQMNSAATPRGGHPTHDWIGNPIPVGARVFGPSSFAETNRHYGTITRVFGHPRHDYVVLPRTSFYAGYFDQDDGFYGFHHHGHRSFISITLFYPFYFSQPDWYAFNYPGFYPSVYSLYGWSPGWVYPDRVYYQDEYTYTPAPYRSGRQLDVAGQGRAINDIGQAWMADDPALFSAHLTDQTDIRIYFNGKYSYTCSTADFYAMTADAMTTTESDSVDFGDPVWISRREVFYSGRQVFNDPDGSQRDLYISYRLRKLGSDWYIVAFGSSPDPIQHQYRDFRNR